MDITYLKNTCLIDKCNFSVVLGLATRLLVAPTTLQYTTYP